MQLFDKTEFAKALKTHRVITMDIGLREVAKKVKISAATLSRIENEKPTEIDTILKLCHWMKLPLTKFITTKRKNGKGIKV